MIFNGRCSSLRINVIGSLSFFGAGVIGFLSVGSLGSFSLVLFFSSVLSWISISESDSNIWISFSENWIRFLLSPLLKYIFLSFLLCFFFSGSGTFFPKSINTLGGSALLLFILLSLFILFLLYRLY